MNKDITDDHDYLLMLPDGKDENGDFYFQSIKLDNKRHQFKTEKDVVDYFSMAFEIHDGAFVCKVIGGSKTSLEYIGNKNGK